MTEAGVRPSGDLSFTESGLALTAPLLTFDLNSEIDRRRNKERHNHECKSHGSIEHNSCSRVGGVFVRVGQNVRALRHDGRTRC